MTMILMMVFVMQVNAVYDGIAMTINEPGLQQSKKLFASYAQQLFSMVDIKPFTVLEWDVTDMKFDHIAMDEDSIDISILDPQINFSAHKVSGKFSLWITKKGEAPVQASINVREGGISVNA